VTTHALNATPLALFAIAQFISQLHKQCAFQASSPKLLSPGASPGFSLHYLLCIHPPGDRIEMKSARRIFIEGHVQGVFFREWTVGRARELDVAGWVRNLQDGRVEIYAVSSSASLAQFVERLRSGSPASRVDRLSVEDAEVERIDGFTRRQSA
jgi:acylphosphatase